ncbi:MAG: DUF2306 domain-containing protein [Hyphomonadaceae bacterium]|nr:DUF2306 domain-containing protein [Hyphomonadaceae bacterium]
MSAPHMNTPHIASSPSSTFTSDQIQQAARQADRHDMAKPAWRRLIENWAGVGIVLFAIAPFVPGMLGWVAAHNVRLTAPDFALLATVPLAVQVHLATVLVALPLGGLILYGPKGTPMHRALGRVWVATMLVTCVAALFIESFAPVIGPFGFIHLLVLWSLYAIGRGLWAIVVRKDLQAHLRNMSGAWWGLIIAGLFTMLPGRLLWSMFTTM